MQNSGTLAELPLEGILETVQRDRATGTLHLASEQGEATLYFLFGHLFHARDGEREGEPVVYEALNWSSGDFTFDSKAKLPAEETIKVSTAELLAARQDAGAAAATAAAPAAEAEAEVTDEAVAEDEGAAEEEEAEEEEPEAEASVEEEEEGEEEPVAETEPEPEAAEPEPVAADAMTNPDGEPQRRRATDKRPDIRPPETMQLYPVPIGKLIYESLTAGFVDYPKLLRSLRKDKHSGYVRLSGDGFDAVLLFSNGEVVEALYDADGEVQTSEAAMRRFGAHIDEGEGVLDVIGLSAEMVTGMYQLLTGHSKYDKLLARFVKPDAMIEYLQEIGHSGAMIARNDKRSGIVIFRQGQVLGCYTDASREVETDTTKFLAVCKEPSTEIEVRGGEVPTSLPVMSPGDGPKDVPSGTPGGYDPSAADLAATEESADVVAEQGSENGASPDDDVDWPNLINELAGRADAVLGTRAKKVKELLFATNHRRDDVEATIDKISELSIMFVDPSKLTALADDMRKIAAAA